MHRMLTKTRALVLSLFAFLLVAPVLAQGNAAEIQRLLKERDREIKSVLAQGDDLTAAQRERLKDLINGAIDFEAMGKVAIGATWGEITPAQRAEFVDVFRQIVRNQSLGDLDVYRTPVTYGDITVDGNTAHVLTTVTLDDKPATVAYDLAYRGGEWRVDDIIVNDVSTAEGYARSFGNAIRKRGFDGLMKALNNKLEKQQAGMAAN